MSPELRLKRTTFSLGEPIDVDIIGSVAMHSVEIELVQATTWKARGKKSRAEKVLAVGSKQKGGTFLIRVPDDKLDYFVDAGGVGQVKQLFKLEQFVRARLGTGRKAPVLSCPIAVVNNMAAVEQSGAASDTESRG